jgi:hypothetical protein
MITAGMRILLVCRRFYHAVQHEARSDGGSTTRSIAVMERRIAKQSAPPKRGAPNIARRRSARDQDQRVVVPPLVLDEPLPVPVLLVPVIAPPVPVVLFVPVMPVPLVSVLVMPVPLMPVPDVPIVSVPVLIVPVVADVSVAMVDVDIVDDESVVAVSVVLFSLLLLHATLKRPRAATVTKTRRFFFIFSPDVRSVFDWLCWRRSKCECLPHLLVDVHALKLERDRVRAGRTRGFTDHKNGNQQPCGRMQEQNAGRTGMACRQAHRSDQKKAKKNAPPERRGVHFVRESA